MATKRPILGNPNLNPKSNPKKTPDELRQFLYNISLTDIPGWRSNPVTQRAILTKPGRQWIKQMAYVLQRNKVDLEPFFDRLNLFFEVEEMEKLAQLVLKTFDRAFEANAMDQKDKTLEKLKDDEEAQYLIDLTSHMKHHDIPGLMPDDQMRPRHLSLPSVMWIQHRIRRIMLKNLYCLNAFLIKVACMFPTTILNVFTPDFRMELHQRLLPRFTHKTSELQKLLDKSSELLIYGSLRPDSGGKHSTADHPSSQQQGSGKKPPLFPIPPAPTEIGLGDGRGFFSNNEYEVGGGYFEPARRPNPNIGTVYTNYNGPQGPVPGMMNNMDQHYSSDGGYFKRPRLNVIGATAAAAAAAAAGANSAAANVSAAGVSAAAPAGDVDVTAISTAVLEAELERQHHLKAAAAHMAAANAVVARASAKSAGAAAQRFTPY